MRPFPRDQALGPYYRFAAVVLWPAMMTLTRHDWRGTEHLGAPGDGLVIAPNHLSWFDPIVLAHFLNDNDRAPRFLAKDAIFDVPVVGTIVGGAGQIPVYRETANAADAVRAAVAAVEGGETVVVYPEGTLTRDPDLWPMTGKTGAARIALLSGRPVIPVAHWGAQEVMRPYTTEFRAFPPKTMHVAAGPPVDLDDLRGLDPTAPVLIEATSRIMDAITELLATLRSESPPSGRWNAKVGAREPVRHPLPRQHEEAEDMAAKKSNKSGAQAAADTAKKAVATGAAAARKSVQKRTAAAEKSVAKATDAARKTVAKRVAAAEKTVAKATDAARKTVAQATPASKKTVAKRASAAKQSAPAKKVATKKAAAKKAATTTATTAKRATAKTATAAKSSARKAAVKTTTAAKKATTKKAAPVKKAAAKKAPAKKAPAKKAPAKAAPAKRTAKRN